MSLNLGLAPGATLRQGTYRIEKVLGQGGFGITYLATDLSLERLVAVKEFFPKDFCDRDASTSHVTLGTTGSEELILKMKAKFLKEARNIAKLNHPGIIKIYASFEENNTAYYVMEYIDGESLSGMVKQGGPLPETKALSYIKKVGHALEYIHDNKINHLDVKPANIMVRRVDDEPILIDFGLSKQYDTNGHQTSTTPVGISHGFAPLEQYNAGGVNEFSPQTDIYSLGATLYYLLSGVVPPQATLLVDDSLTFPKNISAQMVTPISKAMAVSRKQRYETVSSFLNDLNGETDNTVIVDDSTSSSQSKPDLESKSPQHPETSGNDGKGRTKLNWALLILVAVFIVMIVLSLTFCGEGSTSPFPAVSGRSYTVNGVTFEMIKVEGGSFQMGGSDWDAFGDEKPVHTEYVFSFQIGKTEVTQALWKAVMGDNPSYFSGDDLPVENVSWDDCQIFISKLNEMTGEEFRLPTEAEWEYAARGGNKSHGYKYSGSWRLSKVAWNEENGGERTHTVATKWPNELGIYDMSGNVDEWTSDLWSYGYNCDRNGGSEGTERVRRGGSWSSDAVHCRVSCRSTGAEPSLTLEFLGLRLAL